MRVRERNRKGAWPQGRGNRSGRNIDQRRGVNNGESANNSYKQLEAETTTFYFTNFPVNYGFKDMWEVFNMYDKVRKVYIPLRRNKADERFGFVRLSKVNDVRAMMEARLNTILIGNKKKTFC